MKPSPKAAPIRPKLFARCFGGRDIRRVRIGDRKACAGSAADDAGDEHRAPARARVASKGNAIRGPAATTAAAAGVRSDPTARRAGRAEELHHAVDDDERTVPVRLQLAAGGVFADQHRQHRAARCRCRATSMKTTTRMNGIAARRPCTVPALDIGKRSSPGARSGLPDRSRAAYIRSGAPGCWNHAVSRRDNSALPW